MRADPGAPRALSPGLARALARLRALEGELDPVLIAHGRTWRRLVPRVLAPDPVSGALACQLALGGGEVARVRLTPAASGLQLACSCPVFAADRQCKHAAALVTELIARLEGARPAAPSAPGPSAREAAVGWRVTLGVGSVALTPLEPPSRPGRPPRELTLARARELLASSRHARDAALLAGWEDGPQSELEAQRRGAPAAPIAAPLALLERLAGHPWVEVAGARGAVAVAPARAGLRVRDLGSGHYLVRVTVDGAPVELRAGAAVVAPGALVAHEREAARLRVAPLGPDACAVLSAVARELDALPRGSVAALIDRVEQRAPELPLELPPELVGSARPAELAIVVRVAPESPERAQVTLHARPLPGGALVIPGAAPARWATWVAGERLRTERDLAGERAAAGAVARALGLAPLAARADEAGGAVATSAAPWAVTLEGASVLLALLERFEAAFPPDGPRQVELEWPADALPRRVVPASRLLLDVDAHDGRVVGVAGWLESAGERVSLAAVLLALEQGRRFVPLARGRVVELRAELAARLSVLALLGAMDERGLELPAAALAALAALLDDEQVALAPGRASLSERLAAGARRPLRAPRGLRAELRPYQLEGYRWLRRLEALGGGGCLADAMGLGKTVQAIALLLRRRRRGPALVVAPTSVLASWARELARFAPRLRVHVHHGAARHEVLAALAPTGDDEEGSAPDARAAREGAGALALLDREAVVVTSWSLLRREREQLTSRRWATVVFDEAQFAKNADSLTAAAARALPADMRLVLTGTPLENHLGELWSVLELALPGLLGSREAFAHQLARPIERGDEERALALARLLRPFVLRRTKEQVLPELPPRLGLRVEVTLDAAERAIYERVRQEGLAAVAEARRPAQRRLRLLSAITRLRLAACHPRLVDPHAPARSSKLEALLLRLERLLAEPGRQALVFSQFVRHLALVEQALTARDVPYLLLTGSTPAAERARRVAAFQAGEARVFLISLRAGGTGLNLTAADVVVHLDPWWNPAAERQATDRAHRIGQERTVTALQLVAAGTVEEEVLALHAQKAALADAVLEGSDGALRLDDDELAALLAGA